MYSMYVLSEIMKTSWVYLHKLSFLVLGDSNISDYQISVGLRRYHDIYRSTVLMEPESFWIILNQRGVHIELTSHCTLQYWAMYKRIIIVRYNTFGYYLMVGHNLGKLHTTIAPYIVAFKMCALWFWCQSTPCRYDAQFKVLHQKSLIHCRVILSAL